MIINHTYQFIFVHVPKNAGTSVTQALSTLSSWRDLEIGGTQLGEAMAPHYMKRFGIRKHSPASQIRSVVGGDIWDRYYKFGFVRDPVSRLHSLWSFLQKWRSWPRAEIMDTFRSIDEFVASEFFRSGGPDQMLRPQSHFLDLPLDFLGSCDATSRHFEAILNAIGVPAEKRPQIGTLNESNSEQADLAPESVKVLEQRWKADFELLSARGS